MKLILSLAAMLACLLVPVGARANDSMATLGAGGLVFVTSPDIALLSEDLAISTSQVRVAYRFRNTGTADQHVMVAFPLPDITGDQDFMVAIPTEDPQNIFGFSTLLDGKPVRAELHQYAFALGIDQTETLQSLGMPLAPYGERTQAALNALGEAQHHRLQQLGLVIPMDYDAGNGPQTDWTPVWTLRSAYSWEADFPAGKTVEVVHSYVPSVGAAAGVAFLAPPTEGYDPAGEYAHNYCTDKDFVASVRRTLPDKAEPYGAPFSETHLSYVWSTGANWNGPIGRFHLSVDKGSPRNLVSFCWDGKVAKTGPTTFEMEAEDFVPPQDHEFDVLILTRWQD